MEVLPLVEVLGVPPLARCSAASAGAAASELRRASFRWSDCSYATSFVSALWFYCAPTLSAADVLSQTKLPTAVPSALAFWQMIYAI